MDQLNENKIEGTIYYENEDMETMYVDQSGVDSDNYQYNNVVISDQETTRDSNREDAGVNDREEESQV